MLGLVDFDVGNVGRVVGKRLLDDVALYISGQIHKFQQGTPGQRHLVDRSLAVAALLGLVAVASLNFRKESNSFN